MASFMFLLICACHRNKCDHPLIWHIERGSKLLDMFEPTDRKMSQRERQVIKEKVLLGATKERKLWRVMITHGYGTLKEGVNYLTCLSQLIEKQMSQRERQVITEKVLIEATNERKLWRVMIAYGYGTLKEGVI